MCTKTQKTLFVMNLKTNEIFTVDNWSISDNVLRVQNGEYLPTEFVWFYSREDAEQFLNEKKNFNFVELVMKYAIIFSIIVAVAAETGIFYLRKSQLHQAPEITALMKLVEKK